MCLATVEQNLSFIEQIADEVLVLDHGECVLAGSTVELGRKSLERHLLVQCCSATALSPGGSVEAGR